MYDYDTCSESVLSNACKKKLKMRNRRETFEELKGKINCRMKFDKR